MRTILINGKEYKFNETIQFTKEYTVFQKLLGNRFIDTNNVKKLVDSMRLKGIIPIPIIVNERMEIIDGQHREAAIEELKGAVPYEIIPGLNLEDCIAINGSQHNWSNLQYVDSYAQRGYEQYKTVMKYINEYSDIKPTTVLRAFGNPGHEYIKDGKFRIGDVVLGNHIIEIIRQIKTTMRKTAGRGVDAVKIMVREGADPLLIKESIYKNGDCKKGVNLGSTENAYAILTELYNKGRSTRKVDFHAYSYINGGI